jgi:methyl-accepting chemotaxis protein
MPSETPETTPKRFSSLKTTLIIFFLIVGLVPLGILEYANFKTAKSSVQNEVSRNLESTVKARQSHMNTYLNEQIFNAYILTIDERIKESLATKNFTHATEFLKEIAEEYENIAHIDLIDDTGTVVSSSLDVKIGGDKKEDSIFTEGKKGVYIKDLHISSSSGEPAFGISRPVIEDGKVIGVVLVDLEANGLYEILTETTGLGESGEVYLVNKDLAMISPSRFRENVILEQEIPVTNHCFTDHSEAAHNKSETYTDYRGINVLGTHLPITGVDWCLISEIDEAEAFISIQRIKFLTSIATLITALIVVLLALIYSNSLTTPLIRLRDFAKEIGEGNLNTQIEISPKNEIGELAETINKMAQQLKHHKEITQAEIEKTTIQLKEANSELDKKIGELDTINEAMTGRELKMIELKEELDKLKNKDR